MKSLFYKFFGIGKILEPLSSELKTENLVVWDEGLKSTITYKNFRAPGRYSNWKRRWISGAFAVTEKRLVLQQFSKPVVNLLLSDARLQKIEVSVEEGDRLLFRFEPNLFLENSSGEIEWRFRSPEAGKAAAFLHSKMK